MNIPRIVLPREHGAWAVLFTPVIAAAAATRSVSSDFILLILSMLMAFLSHVPLHMLFREYSDRPGQEGTLVRARFWAAAYLLMAVIFIFPVLSHGYHSVIVLGLLAGAALSGNFFLTRNFPRTIPGDLAAVFGLTLSGPASYYVLNGSFDRMAFVQWMFNLLFFGYCVFYVHMKMRASATKKTVLSGREKFFLSTDLIAFYIVAVCVLLYLVLDRVTPAHSLIAFVPVTLQGLYGTVNLSGKVRLRNLGLTLLGQAVLFAILLGMLK